MEQLQFKISSALKDLVGKDLIINDNVAIFELVKNAYDAYAKKVEIEFLDDKIIIADNGKGMSLKDIKDKWLFLGYSAKKDGTEDNNSDDKQTSYRDKIRRHYAGAKGIGRFSCDRLGKELLLKTKSVSSNKLEIIQVNWTDFEVDQNLEFANINVGHDTLTTSDTIFPEKETHGTILEIRRLNDEKMPWNRKRLLDLKHSLEKLINPFAEISDFCIEIKCNRELAEDKSCIEKGKHERELVNGVLKNSITSILDLKTTQIDVKLSPDYITTTLTDRGVEMYTIREKNNSFDKLKDVSINLYFLNRSAKNNFTRLMGIEPVNYGSVFLFRNGFRIMPFGNTGDDSWGLDYRAQQGHNRFLGTRDLFGRVDVLTDNVEELKEVSSRDGGLIETQTSQQLFNLFEVAHRRLERYVSGVLWGEAFLKKEYFRDANEALERRKELLENDKENDNPNYVINSSIGSKIDFIQLIKTLTRDKNVEIVSYNKDLANILSDPEEIDNIKPQFINDLEKIAESTNDENMLLSIDEAKQHIRKLRKEKEAAEQRAIEAEKKREEAERKAQEETLKRIEAERKKEEEAEAKRKAELQAKEAELKRREEELLRKEAEQKRKEEEEKRKKAEKKLDQKTKQNLFLQSVENLDKDRIIKYHHDIRLNAHTIQNSLDNIIKQLYKGIIDKDNLTKALERISKANRKVLSISRFATKANFNVEGESLEADIVEFVNQYLTSVLPDYYEEINLFCETNNCKRVMKFRPLELNLLIDNLLSNSIKAGARHFNVVFTTKDNMIEMSIFDDGQGIANSLGNQQDIFEKGVTTTSGSGLGLYNAKMYVEKELKGTIAIDTTYRSQNNNKGKGLKLDIIF